MVIVLRFIFRQSGLYVFLNKYKYFYFQWNTNFLISQQYFSEAKAIERFKFWNGRFKNHLNSSMPKFHKMGPKTFVSIKFYYNSLIYF